MSLSLLIVTFYNNILSKYFAFGRLADLIRITFIIIMNTVKINKTVCKCIYKIIIITIQLHRTLLLFALLYLRMKIIISTL